MKAARFFFGTLFYLCFIFLLVGCGKPGSSSSNLTNSFVTIVSINDNAPLESDVLTNGAATPDIVTFTFKSQPRQLGDGDNPTDPDGRSPFDTITLRSYHIEYLRSDGGPNPPHFTDKTTITLEPDSEVSADIIVVYGFFKHRSPLKELRDDGQLVTSCTVTFYGEDGYGNDIKVDGSLAISFANYPDQ
jgi:hypothetical protein